MDDREALLRAICTRPDEDTPRLMYADWLSQHGTEREQELAGFIRAQIWLTALKDRPIEDEERLKLEVTARYHLKKCSTALRREDYDQYTSRLNYYSDRDYQHTCYKYYKATKNDPDPLVALAARAHHNFSFGTGNRSLYDKVKQTLKDACVSYDNYVPANLYKPDGYPAYCWPTDLSRGFPTMAVLADSPEKQWPLIENFSQDYGLLPLERAKISLSGAQSNEKLKKFLHNPDYYGVINLDISGATVEMIKELAASPKSERLRELQIALVKDEDRHLADILDILAKSPHLHLTRLNISRPGIPHAVIAAAAAAPDNAEAAALLLEHQLEYDMAPLLAAAPVEEALKRFAASPAAHNLRHLSLLQTDQMSELLFMNVDSLIEKIPNLRRLNGQVVNAAAAEAERREKEDLNPRRR